MRFFRKLGVPFIFLFAIAACTTQQQNATKEFEVVYDCNAEQINAEKNLFSETDGKEIFFENVNSISTEFAHSGQHSIKLFPGNPFGFTTYVDSILPDDYLVLTAWRKKPGGGVIVADGGPGFYYAGYEVVDQAANGWEKIWLEIFVPPTFDKRKLKIYAWNNTNDTTYFDDLQIIHRRNKVYPVYDSIYGLVINVDQQDIDKLSQKRLEAFKTSILMNSDDDYANAILFDGNEFLNGEVRLKGDLVDHLLGRKWSFRVKLKNDFTWKHLRTFSIQNPITRYFLNEWLAHKIFDQENVLTTRYGFVPVTLNNTSLGIYAYEEHFEKQLVESRNRREGPIIRFNEDVFWKRNQESVVTQANWDIDYFSAAKIIPFKEGSVTGDSLMLFQFEEAQNLLYQFKNRERPVSQIFDVDQLAKYYALLDFTQAYHGFVWHNQRFYYNPVTCLLERVAFDGYIDNGIYRRFDELVTGLVDPAKMASLQKEELMLYQVFCDSAFNEKYLAYLKDFSDEGFIRNIEDRYQNEADSLAELIKQEFPYYKFSFAYLEAQAAQIRNNLPAIAENVYKLGEAVKNIPNNSFKHQYTTEINASLVPYQIHAFYNSEKNELKVLNYANSEVKVLGVSVKKGLPISLETENKLAPFDGVNESSVTLIVEDMPQKLLFSVGEAAYETEVSMWKAPGGNSQRQKLDVTKLNHNLQVTDGKVILDGNYRFATDVVIPANLELVVKAGTTIDCVENAGFFCFSPVRMEGTEANPIKITSSDRSANGFNVLQPHSRSGLSFVHFSGFGSIRKKGWQTPAAVTFYEADVDFQNCTFASNSNCDDALNVVRSNFDVRNCNFENTFADAFDSDFCTGLVSDCNFQKVGNDAIDFSGSQVKIIGCTMNEIGDKAVSGGEKSTLTVERCDIDNANIGVASKDLSLVKLNKITMKNIVYGLVAFQKKPEYGPAKIEIENLKMRNKISFQKIEEGSTLTLNGKLMRGREKKLALKLYQ